jgi:hypothetical protein
MKALLIFNASLMTLLGILFALSVQPPGSSEPARASEISRYIVQFKEDQVTDVDATIAELQTRHAFTVMVVYYHAIKGFAGDMTEETALSLANEPVVQVVEPDAMVEITQGWGDVNCDGTTDAVDALDVLRYVGGLAFREGMGCRAGGVITPAVP